MRFHRASIVWVGLILGFLACSTAPSTTTTSSTTSTSTGTGGKGGGTGTGGMDAGSCEHWDDYYELCGDCKECLQFKCCAQLLACAHEPGCIDCVSNNPDAAGPCFQYTQQVLLACSAKCSECHDSTPNTGCFLDAGPDGGGTGGVGGGAK